MLAGEKEGLFHRAPFIRLTILSSDLRSIAGRKGPFMHENRLPLWSCVDVVVFIRSDVFSK